MTQPAALLDHRGQPIQAVVSRVAPQPPRQMRARYDAAQTTDENTRHWANADAYSAAAALNPQVRRTLRNRSRYECANNTYAAGMITTLASDTIGTGPSVQITNEPEDAAEQIETAFWNWMQAVELPMKLRTMRMAKARDGESFASFFTNMPLSNGVKLDLQVHEAEMIANPFKGFSGRLTDTELTQSMYDGIIFDKLGNVTSYSLLNHHPGDATLVGMPGDATEVDARDMLHLYNCDRPGQYRGAPEITPALPLYAQLRRYTLAVIRCAESAAIPSWVIESSATAEDVAEIEPLDTLETERGMGLTLPRGWQMGQIKAEQPTGTYAEFKHQILEEIARCLCMPYNIAAGISAGYNYSSGRLDHKTYYRSLRVERSMIELIALERIFARWWQEAVLIEGYLPERFFGQKEVPTHEWRWDGDEHVDPTKEADAAETRVRMGLSCLQDECTSLGKDFATIQKNNAEALGLSLVEYRKRLADYYLPPTQSSVQVQQQRRMAAPQDQEDAA